MNRKVLIYYSLGHRVRAEGLQVFIEKMAAFYRDRLGLSARIDLAVLEKKDWEAINPTLYGMPSIKGTPPVIFMPATPGGVVKESVLSLRNAISTELMSQLTNQGITFDEAASKFVDLIIFHELGHYFVKKYGILLSSKWLNETLATYFGYLFLNTKMPKLKILWDLIATRLFIENVSPKYRSLSDFEKLYSSVGLQNYGWYQAMFNLRVSEVCSNQGLAFLKKMKKEFPDTPFQSKVSITLRSKIKSTTPKKLLEKMERIAPGFKKWAERFDN